MIFSLQGIVVIISVGLLLGHVYKRKKFLAKPTREQAALCVVLACAGGWICFFFFFWFFSQKFFSGEYTVHGLGSVLDAGVCFRVLHGRALKFHSLT